MAKKAVFGILFSIIILASFVLAQVSSSPSATKYNTAGMSKEQLQAVETASTDERIRITDSITDSADENFDYDAYNAIYEKYDNMPAFNAYQAAWLRGRDEDKRCGETCAAKANLDRKEGTGDWEYARRCGAECDKIRDEADLEAYRAYVEIAIQNNNNMIAEMSALAKKPASGVDVVKKEDIPAGPGFNTNPERGRTEKGLIAPSFGGYLGNAYVQRPDGTKVIPGKELYLKVNDKVITGEESKVNIMFGNAGRMNLGPNTELRVGSALLDQYYLAKGTLKTKLDWTAGAKLQIDTMNAAIFQKHTEFVVDYNETTNTTTVFLNEGELEIRSATQTITLTAGNYCTIGPDGVISSNQLVSGDWKALGSRFYEEVSQDTIFKIYAWLTFAVLVLSVVIVAVVIHREKKKQHKKEQGKNLGWLSILFGLLGIVGCLFPIIGFPLSFTSTTLARIQKLRTPTISAKIGFVLGCIGAVVNGIVFIAFFSYMGVI